MLLTLCAPLGNFGAPEAVFAQGEELPHSALSKNYPLIQSEKQFIRVRIEFAPRCSFGDIDAIGAELSHANKTRQADQDKAELLLTLETILPEDVHTFSPVVHHLHRLNLKDDIVFEFPTPARPITLGIFICSYVPSRNQPTSARIEGCQRKPVFTFEQLMANHAATMNPETGKIEMPEQLRAFQEKIYYFQHFLWEPERLVFNAGLLQDSIFDQWAVFFQKHSYDSRRALLTVERLRVLHRMNSMPLQSKDKTFIVTLPFFQPKKCGA